MDSKNLDHLRHSAAQLLSDAVVVIWPQTKATVGSPIEEGFYCDFDLGQEKISDKDFSRIENKMHELAKLKQLKYFKLLSIAGAYFQGDEKNKMLTRIHGTVFPSQKELDDHLKMLEEAKKRDHRKIGEALELFTISSLIGPGLPIFLPKGEIVREIVLKYLTDIKRKNGYQFVWSPHIARSETYHISQHWGKYDAMFAPMKLDKEEYVLKPMNCPHHFQVYLNRPRSYKELPFRIAENGTVYRHEKSGEVSGLVRVRALTIDDTHTFIKYRDTMGEIKRVLEMILKIFNTFHFKDFKARISVGDRKHQEKYLGSPQEWERAEEALKRGAESLKIEYEIGEGEAAFYGPKIDIMVKDSLGRSWQLSTVQLDYNQPKNFNMKYVDEDGSEVYPAILHIAMIGSLERFMGILIEHYAGAFPLWLSPVQVAILPVSDKFIDYAKLVQSELVKHSIRVELSDDSKPLGAKIRQSTLQKVPYMIIIGEKEMKLNSISVRSRDGKEDSQDVNKFINQLKSQIENFS